MREKKQWYSFLFLLMVCFSLIGCEQREVREYALQINQESVSKGEFMLYLYEVEQEFETVGGKDIWDTDFEGQTASEAAKDRALNSVKMVKLSSQNAGRFQVKLTPEEKAKAEEDAKALYENIPEQIKTEGDIQMKDAMKTMEDKARYTKVVEALTKEYVPSEADFQIFYEANKEAYQKALRLYSLKSILVSEEAVAREVYEKAIAGADFAELAEEYEIDEGAKKTGGQMEAYQGMLESQFDTEFALGIGDVSEILKASEGYYILKVEDIAEPTEEQTVSYARSQYVERMKQQLFLQEYNKWAEEAAVEKNEAVWDTITAGSVE